MASPVSDKPARRPRISRAGKLVLLLVAICVVSWAAALLLRRDNLLLSRATAHPAASKQLQSDTYWWISNDEFVEPMGGVAVRVQTGVTRSPKGCGPIHIRSASP